MQHFISAPELPVLKVSHKLSLDKDDDSLTYSGIKSGTHWRAVDGTEAGTIDAPKGKVFDNDSNSSSLKSFHASKASTFGFETYVRLSSAQYFTFDKNSPEVAGQIESQIIAADKAENLKENSFKYAGYHLKEWNTEGDGTDMRYDAGQVCFVMGAEYKRPITLFAQWEPNRYTITFDSNAPEHTVPFGTVLPKRGVAYGKKIKLSKIKLSKNGFIISGYDFVGWTLNKEGVGTLYDDEQKDVCNLTDGDNDSVTLYAQWKGSA